MIHKNLKLNSIKDLKGLKSCHTGVARNVGYKFPITKLKNMGIIGSLNEEGLSARENELKAFSNFFSKACIVGQWSPDPIINAKLSACVVLENRAVFNFLFVLQRKNTQTCASYVNIRRSVITRIIFQGTKGL